MHTREDWNTKFAICGNITLLKDTNVYYCCYWYGDSVDDTVENSSIFSQIGMCWLPTPSACGQ